MYKINNVQCASQPKPSLSIPNKINKAKYNKQIDRAGRPIGPTGRDERGAPECRWEAWNHHQRHRDHRSSKNRKRQV